jgi:3-hydroxy acid dehydrogenase/malonic semialdehyde reductase
MAIRCMCEVATRDEGVPITGLFPCGSGGKHQAMDLQGRTILVTGSNRGIGHAIVSRLAREPVRLLAGVRELGRYEPPEVRDGLLARIEPVHVDLSSREAIERSCDALGEELARIDVLINNAGEFAGGTVDQLDVEAIYATVQANLTGLMHLTRRVLPGMLGRDQGMIVNQASIISHLEYPGTGVYAATKAGVATFTHCLQRELAETRVGALEVITGGYDTDMLRQAARELAPHTDPGGWEWRDPGDWAERIVDAIRGGKETLEPGGKSQLGRLAAQAPRQILDAVARLSFTRR